MPAQSYANHAHRPIYTVVAFICVVFAIVSFVMWFRSAAPSRPLAMGLVWLTAAVIVLISMSRVYTTALQDRIIRLEMRVRGAGLLTPAQQRALEALGLRRIAALRFASDQELPALLDRAVADSLTADQIKRAVKTWVPDLDRT